MQVEIRRIRPSDSEMLSAFYSELSADSLYSRFLGFAHGISNGLARSFCRLDHMHDEGFVALVDVAEQKRIVGHLCFAHVDQTQLELGVAVSDEFHGHRIGRRLFETALNWAADHQFTTVVATCFADNSAALRLLTSAPYGASVSQTGGGVVDVTIPLQAQLPRPSFSYPPESGSRLRRARRAASTTPSRPRHVFWRRRPQPGRVAGG
jgi:RimJ/RimL family protein N-acetyltransferase